MFIDLVPTNTVIFGAFAGVVYYSLLLNIVGDAFFQPCPTIYVPCVVHPDFITVAAVLTVGKLDYSNFVGNQ